MGCKIKNTMYTPVYKKYYLCSQLIRYGKRSGSVLGNEEKRKGCESYKYIRSYDEDLMILENLFI